MKYLRIVLSNRVEEEFETNEDLRHSGGAWREERYFIDIYDDIKAVEIFEEIKKMLKGKKS